VGLAERHRRVWASRASTQVVGWGSLHVAEALGGAAEGSYEQEAAVVEEDEEMEREGPGRTRGGEVARPQRVGCAGMGRTGIG
jgi:hypothetical protein